MSPGEKRRRLANRERKRAVYDAAMAQLPESAKCASCTHVDTEVYAPQLICDLDSGFDGYQLVTSNHRCPRWEAANTKK
jgi:hypothetical protein